MLTAWDRRGVLGLGLAVIGLGVLAAIMVPVRTGLSEATPALVLVLPVVAGATIGGLSPGAVAAVAGFVIYDVLFIRPYDTLTVGSGQGWVALVVYLAVVVLVSQLISSLTRARADARRLSAETRRISDLTERLIPERPLPELLHLVADAIRDAFGPKWTAVLLPEDGQLNVVATAGDAPATEVLAHIRPTAGHPQTLGVWGSNPDGVVSVALDVQGRPIGLLALAGVDLDGGQREHQRLYAGQVARAVERSQLQELALTNEALEASDRWRRALLGAVSHDLRTPLATIKAAVTALIESKEGLSPDEQDELLGLVESQSDDLARLVTNLLDATRIQAGAFKVQRQPMAVQDLVESAVRALGGSVLGSDRSTLGDVDVVVALDDAVPMVDVDELLMVQAVANLLDNARRHSPPGAFIDVWAQRDAEGVSLVVRDRGPGVPAELRDRVFELWTTSGGDERAGLGLSIVKAFVEAHDQQVRLDTSFGEGASFVITLAVSTAEPSDSAIVDEWAPAPPRAPSTRTGP